MKPKITIKPDLKQLSYYNQKYDQALKILSLNNIDLRNFLADKISKNVFLSYQVDQQTYEYLANTQQYKPSLYQNFISQLPYIDIKLDYNLFNFLFSNLDSNGYFKNTFDELCKLSKQSSAKLKKIISVLQEMEPIGCFSFSLSDCLKAQCKASPMACSETAEILCDHLNMVAEGNIKAIAELSGLSFDEIIEGIKFIKTLNPKPAINFAEDANIILPEVKITRSDDKLDISLINDDLNIQFNDMDASQLNNALKAQRYEALAIMNSIKKRNLTIMQITNALCTIQQAFFLYDEPLSYCTLQDVSNITGLHPSTISRAIQNKAFEYKNKYYLYKMLFNAKGNKKISGNTILHAINTIIENEDKAHPLSDEKIKNILEKQNIYISRRTINKYRDENNIPHASARKKLKNR